MAPIEPMPRYSLVNYGPGTVSKLHPGASSVRPAGWPSSHRAPRNGLGDDHREAQTASAISGTFTVFQGLRPRGQPRKSAAHPPNSPPMRVVQIKPGDTHFPRNLRAASTRARRPRPWRFYCQPIPLQSGLMFLTSAPRSKHTARMTRGAAIHHNDSQHRLRQSDHAGSVSLPVPTSRANPQAALIVFTRQRVVFRLHGWSFLLTQTRKLEVIVIPPRTFSMRWRVAGSLTRFQIPAAFFHRKQLSFGVMMSRTSASMAAFKTISRPVTIPTQLAASTTGSRKHIIGLVIHQPARVRCSRA